MLLLLLSDAIAASAATASTTASIAAVFAAASVSAATTAVAASAAAAESVHAATHAAAVSAATPAAAAANHKSMVPGANLEAEKQVQRESLDTPIWLRERVAECPASKQCPVCTCQAINCCLHTSKSIV